MSLVIDDHHLRSALIKGISAQLLALTAGDLIVTTTRWATRLRNAFSHPQSGSLSRHLGAEQRRRALLALETTFPILTERVDPDPVADYTTAGLTPLWREALLVAVDRSAAPVISPKNA